jgi:hypothetical protein
VRLRQVDGLDPEPLEPLEQLVRPEEELPAVRASEVGISRELSERARDSQNRFRLEVEDPVTPHPPTRETVSLRNFDIFRRADRPYRFHTAELPDEDGTFPSTLRRKRRLIRSWGRRIVSVVSLPELTPGLTDLDGGGILRIYVQFFSSG